MLKNPIKAGRVYLNGKGQECGPMEWEIGIEVWVDQRGFTYEGNGLAYAALQEGDTGASLVSRVKTPKADKADSKPAKGRKWRDAWVVAGILFDHKDDAKHTSKAYNDAPIRRARVRIDPVE